MAIYKPNISIKKYIESKKLGRVKQIYSFYKHGYYSIYYSQTIPAIIFLYKFCSKVIGAVTFLKTLIWRSIYISSKRLDRFKKGFLINLYFFYRIKIFNHFLLKSIGGWVNENTRGWGVCYTADGGCSAITLRLHIIFSYLVHNVFFEVQKINLFAMTYDWNALYPKGWKTLKNSTWYSLVGGDDGLSYKLQNYLNNESELHFLQYNIRCQIPVFEDCLLKNTRILSPWYLKVIALRILGYPVTLQKGQLRLISNLATFGYKRILDWELLLDSDQPWQGQYVTVRLIEIIEELVNIQNTGIITELIIKKAWNSLFQRSDIFGLSIRYELLFNSGPFFLIHFLIRRLKLQELKIRLNSTN